MRKGIPADDKEVEEDDDDNVADDGSSLVAARLAGLINAVSLAPALADISMRLRAK
jgi:hypothetical protein